MWNISKEEVQKLVAAIDYSEALTITATEKDVVEACEAGRNYGFRAVVAFPQFIGVIADRLKGSGVLAQIPVGFPCGGTTTRVKCVEAEEGLKRGATDLDMVMNIAAFKGGEYAKVRKDIEEVLAVARPFKVPFKVIIEIGVLTEEEICTASRLVLDSGADFVKTCTGFGRGQDPDQSFWRSGFDRRWGGSHAFRGECGGDAETSCGATGKNRIPATCITSGISYITWIH